MRGRRSGVALAAVLAVAAAVAHAERVPAPTISGYRTPAGTAIGSAAAGTQVVIVGANLEGTSSVQFSRIPSAPVRSSSTAITVTVPMASSYPHVGPVTVTVGDHVATGPEFTITAPLRPPSVLNVSNYGARGDGDTDDRAAIQRALDAAKPGDAVYFPAGNYRISGALLVREDGLRLYGDASAPTIQGDTTAHHLFDVHHPSRALTGVRFERLRFLGARVFHRETHWGSGVSLTNAHSTLIRDCRFDGCGAPIVDGGDSSGTSVVDCRILDWGGVGYTAGAGAIVRQCAFVQADPSVEDRATSIAVRFQPDASNCLIEESTFSGVRFAAIEVSGPEQGSGIRKVRIERNTFTDNSQDIIVQTPRTNVSQIGITENRFLQTRGLAVQIKQGDRISVARNQFVASGTGAVRVGDWPTFEAGSVLSNVTVEENRYTRSGGATLQHVFFVSGARGSLSNVLLLGNSVDAFREPKPFQSAAIHLEEVQGALVMGNELTMAPGAGSTNVCAGVRIIAGSGLQVRQNSVNGTGSQYAYGVFATNLANSGSLVADNMLHHCQLQAGGALESNNKVVYP